MQSILFENKKFFVPQLFLYSRTDTISPVSDIRSLIQREKKFFNNNFPIVERDFVDSGHCSHYVSYRHQYIRELKGFLELVEKYKSKKNNTSSKTRQKY